MAPNSSVFVATQSFAVELHGEPIVIQQGITRVAAGHELIEMCPDRFEPAEDTVHFGIEQATAAPGEKRNAPDAKPSAKNPAAKAAAKKAAAKASTEPAQTPAPADPPADDKAGEKS